MNSLWPSLTSREKERVGQLLDSLPFRPDPNRKKTVRAAINNAFAFGGQNSCIVCTKYEEGS